MLLRESAQPGKPSFQLNRENQDGMSIALRQKLKGEADAKRKVS
jgi:hypothetical protein